MKRIAESPSSRGAGLSVDYRGVHGLSIAVAATRVAT